ncbi:uncharacterized protein BX664DRAFT_360660 [Halteromyces radiatus]|uniref:uncharacterized protein n=1 Tax=Halteromyces radiatus TaxID=101107 RepID=UPI00221E4E4B|nr:uncharacterized protein BX664DRAFT_360660 [Halteromyces radiatus]KAI8084833.1 hypothetical protein BX664DRAFT_360660 [Halteromyces radiatus]
MSAKKTPCDECRERKRRCSYESPCQRCIKFDVPCVYTIKNSPADEEYLRQIKLLEQVDQLHGQLDSMQQEMSTLYVTNVSSPMTEEVSSPSSTLSQSQSTSTTLSTFSDLTSSPSLSHSEEDLRIVKRQRTQCGLEATLFENTQLNQIGATKNWTLSVSKGNIIIRTDIKTHSQLLDYLSKSITTIEMNDVIPYSINDLNKKDGILSSVLQVFVWKRYGKSRYKNITRGLSRTLTNHDITNMNYSVIYNDSIETITLKLLQSYLCCQHLNHLSIHVPTFLKLLVRPDIMKSPAVLALCALICTSSCRHVAAVLPIHQEVESYSRYYFEQARELASDIFDHADLETFATYVFLASYKLQINQMEDSQRYGDMAERISIILEDELGESGHNQQQMNFDPMTTDKHHTLSSIPASSVTSASSTSTASTSTSTTDMTDMVHGKKILYRRLQHGLFEILSVIYISKHRHNAKKRDHHPPVDRRVVNLFHGISELLEPAADDSEQEKRHIQLKAYIANLNNECHHTAHRAPAEDTANYVGIISHMVEMAMRRWYAALPESFRLDLPIFDAFYSMDMENGQPKDLTATNRWFQAVENIPDVIPLLTTLTVYNECLMMAKAHICKTPDDIEKRASLATYWKENKGYIDLEFVRAQWGDKWVMRLQRLEKLLEMKKAARYYENKANGISDDDDDDDDDKQHDDTITSKKKYDDSVIGALLKSGYTDFDDPAAHTAVTAGLNAIQLLQYLQLRYPCQYDQRVALNAWDLLMRAVQFDFGNQRLKSIIQASLLRCLNMIREEFKRTPFQSNMLDYVFVMERQYDELFL